MRRWLQTLAAVGASALAVVGAKHIVSLRQLHDADTPPPAELTAKKPAPAPRAAKATHEEPLAPPFRSLDLTKMAFDDAGATARLAGGKIARLSIDPKLQAAAERLMGAYDLKESAIVIADPGTGRVLAYASHASSGKPRDLCREASAPAASVFKIVTGSALLAHGGLKPTTKSCYSGGRSSIQARDLVPNVKRDTACATLADAMGRSLNTVFARHARDHLDPKLLQGVAESYGFNQTVPFDVPVEASKLDLPSDELGYARTAAGFWNSTLSPLEAAWMAATVARGGEAVRLRIVDEVRTGENKRAYAAPAVTTVHRVLSPEVALGVTAMMERTVNGGTARRSFHDAAGRPYFPGMRVAGKTGTLTDHKRARFYTWFVGFAPSEPVEGVRPVAIAVLAVNGEKWRIKAPHMAREMLRVYFADQNVPRVTRPKLLAHRTGKH